MAQAKWAPGWLTESSPAATAVVWVLDELGVCACYFRVALFTISRKECVFKQVLLLCQSLCPDPMACTSM